MSSWLDKIQKVFSITTGDNKVYKPNSFNANRAVEYNFAEFNFRNLDGTLVDRRRKMGTVYSLELYFQGEDNIDVATAFQKSADNRNAWTIKHPFYGILRVQPISPVFHDNGNKLLNVTKITVTVRETIGAAALKNAPDDTDVIATKQTNVNATFNNVLVGALPTPSVTAIETLSSNLTLFRRVLNKVQDVGSIITNGYNAGMASINDLYTAGNEIPATLSLAVSNTQYFINSVALLEESISAKVTYIGNELASLYPQATALHIPALPAFELLWKDLKNIWCATAGACVAGMCGASVYNIQPGDYTYSSQVGAVIAQIVTAYNQYLTYLDGMQTLNGGELDSFIPDPTALLQLDDLVNYTIEALYVIQANSKQPRVITLTRDSNVILIARELYGLLADDSTITQIIADNNICNSEIFQVLKGRQILYYV